jgi:hypothetical protein
MTKAISTYFTDPITTWMKTAIYVAYMPGLPDIIVGRMPADLAGTHRSPWKTWICETSKEKNKVLSLLAKPCPITNGALDFIRGPDGALSRPASGMTFGGRNSVSVALYEPPESGWPWIILTSVPCKVPGLARGRYGWDAFSTEAEAMAFAKRLLGRHNVEIHSP